MDTYQVYPKQFSKTYYKLNNNTCFVIMPFSKDLDNTYLVIESVASRLKIKCNRADNISTTSEPILNKICTQISQAYYIIVDITNLNPNVFYELGVAHVIRDASKVLIIKEKETLCPSDIRHLHYYEYEKSELAQLQSIVNNFFLENNLFEDLQRILELLGLLPDNESLSNSFIAMLIDCTANLQGLILVLNNKSSEITNEVAHQLLYDLTDLMNSLSQSDPLYELCSSLILAVVSKTYLLFDVSDFLVKILDTGFKNITDDWRADCCILTIDNPSYFALSIGWIVEYLKKTSPAAFDLTKYKIEIGIIQSKSELVDAFLVDKLQSKNKTLAEHCAKLIKERKTYLAMPFLLELISDEENPYVVRSCMDAVVGMASIGELLKVKRIMNNRRRFVNENPFIEKHLDDIEKRIAFLEETTYS